MNKAVFIDKDGTLINDVPYNVDTSLIEFTNGAIEGLQWLSRHGYLLIIISNQSGIAFNYFVADDVLKVKNYICSYLLSHGITLNGFYYCPHHPEGKNKSFAIHCDCRKPLPGLIIKAAEEQKIDLAASWMIGDILNDVEAGNRAGCRTVLINNANETEWILNKYRNPDYKAKDLSDAATYILNHE